MAEDITKNLPDGVNTWFAKPAAKDDTPDIILKNNGTLRIYTKNRVLAKNLVLQAEVEDLGKVLNVANGAVPSVEQIQKSSRLDWFVNSDRDELFEIITPDGPDEKKALKYTKV